MKLTTLKNPSIKVDGNIPDFFNFEESQLATFIKYYYEWLEQNGNVEFENRRLLDYNDIDYREGNYQKFDGFLRNEFLKNLPANLQVDERLLIKNIRDFYKAKGTEESIRILFKILFNDDAEVSYPGRFILRASDGKWVIERSLKVALLIDSITDINQFDFVIGERSNASGKIERAITYFEGESIITEIFISNIVGDFQAGEYLLSKLTGETLAIIRENGVVVYPGRYANTDGFLSSDKRLQDNYYYQEYSYVIRSPRSANYYSKVVKDLVHPTGTIFFSDVFFQLEFDTENSSSITDNVFKKNIEFPIDLHQYISFVVESTSEKIGSTNARYVFEYEIDLFDGSKRVQNYEDALHSINYTNQSVQDRFGIRTVDNIFNGSKAGDVLEFTNESRNAYLKIMEMVAPNNILIHGSNPYYADPNSFVKKGIETDSRIETQVVRNYIQDFQGARVRDFNSYTDNKGYILQDIKRIPIKDLKEFKFVEFKDRKELLSNVKRQSILELTDGLNNPELHVVMNVYRDDLLSVRDAIPGGSRDDIQTKIYNL